MKIGFDVSQTAENMAGCGFFSHQLISHLLEIDQRNDYLLYPVFYQYRHPNYQHAFRSNQHNAKSLYLEYSLPKLNDLWNNTAVLKDEILGFPDIVHSNNFSCPTNCNAKKIVTVYDMGYLDHPEFTTEANRLVCFDGAFNSSIYADLILTISNYSKAAFLKYFPSYPEERVAVVYLGNRPSIKKEVSDSIKEKVLRKFNIGSDFWLGVGTIEPRKNYRMLLEAYSRLKHEEGEQKPLYIVGGKGWLENDIQLKVQELNIEDRIRFLGYVSDEELSVLYSTCYAFIYPSHYEGFGLPVLEAMSCGAPVITSNTTSLPEVLGEAGLYINPQDANSLIHAMKSLNLNESLRSELVEKSLKQSRKFSWRKAAEEVRELYDRVMGMDAWYKTMS